MKIDIADLTHAQAKNFLLSAVVPRAIAMVSTIGENSILNLAPFANFGKLNLKPAIVFLGVARIAGKRKDTINNILYSKEFVVNTVDESMVDQIVECGIKYPADVSEFEMSGLTPVESELVTPPRVKESPISMECKLKQILEFGEYPDITEVALAEAVLIHVRDDLWDNGIINLARLKPLGRLGVDYFGRFADAFQRQVPKL